MAEATPKKTNYFAVPSGHRAILLVPYAQSLQDKVSEMLEAAGHEDLPKIVTSVKLRRLNDLDVLFTAVPVATKLDARKQPKEYSLKLSKSLAISKFIPMSDEDVDPDYSAIIDSVAQATHPTCHPQVSEDQILKLIQ